MLPCSLPKLWRSTQMWPVCIYHPRVTSVVYFLVWHSGRLDWNWKNRIRSFSVSDVNGWIHFVYKNVYKTKTARNDDLSALWYTKKYIYLVVGMMMKKVNLKKKKQWHNSNLARSDRLTTKCLVSLQMSINFCQNSSLEEQQFSTVVMSWRLNALKIWHILSKNVMSSVCTLNKPNFLLVTKGQLMHFFVFIHPSLKNLEVAGYCHLKRELLIWSQSISQHVFKTFEKCVLFRPLLAIYITSKTHHSVLGWRCGGFNGAGFIVT